MRKKEITERVDQKNTKFSKLEYISKQNNLKDIMLAIKNLEILRVAFVYKYFCYAYEFIIENAENKRKEKKEDFEKFKENFLIQYNNTVGFIKNLQQNSKD